MPQEQPLNEIKANLFKGLAHPVRIRVLEILAADDEVPVSALIAGTGLEASHLSQHLAVLRRYQLVASERRGSQVLYRLASEHVADLLRVARELLAEMLRTTERHLATLDSPDLDPGRAPAPAPPASGEPGAPGGPDVPGTVGAPGTVDRHRP